MQLLNTLAAGIAFIAATVSALPAPMELDIHYKQFAGNPFELTELNLDRVQDGNATIAFTIYNPDPLANVTATCTASWPYGSSGWPSAVYKSCENKNGTSSFAWHMDEFNTWTDFTLEVKDTFRDPR